MNLTLFPTTLSVTSDINTFIQCPYLWSLNRIFWYRQPVREYHKDLDFGAFNAKAHQIVLEAYYADLLSAEDAIAKGIDFINTEYATAYALSGSDEPIKNPSKMAEVLQRYFKEIPLDHDGIVPFLCSDFEHSVEKSFYVELPFKHPETGLPLLLSAKPDMLGVEQFTKKLVVVDDKTAGQSGASSEEARSKTEWGYKLSNQFVQYATVVNFKSEEIGFRKATHAEIRRIVLTQAKLGKPGQAIPAKTEVVEKYHFSLSEWYQQTWYNNLIEHIVPAMLASYQRLKETGDNAKAFQRSYGNCVTYFRPCFFKEHCTEASWQNIQERYGMQQLVYDKETDTAKTLEERRKELGL